MAINGVAMNIDSWCENFGLKDNYAIWGCGPFAKELINAMKDKISITYLVDIDVEKQGKTFCGIPVYSPDKLNSNHVKIVISNRYMGTRTKIVDSLKSMGFVENKDFTYAEVLLSIFNWIIDKKIYSQYVEIPTTTFCTLNCVNCTAYMPYVKNRRHLPIDTLKSGCDSYFKCVDYVERFRILGGEPLIYPNLIELIEYLGERYRDKIGELCIVTNGTVNISDELLVVLKKYTVSFFVSDYTASGHRLTTESSYKRLFDFLEKEGISYYITKDTKWMEIGSPLELRSDSFDTNSLISRFDDCRHYCRSIVDNHLFMCANWAFAVGGGIYTDNLNKFIGDEIMDLDEIGKLNRDDRFVKWFRFDVEMQVKNKYLDFCKYCNGFGSHNKKFVIVGEQVKPKSPQYDSCRITQKPR